jgi:hypothetical protein
MGEGVQPLTLRVLAPPPAPSPPFVGRGNIYRMGGV